MYKLLITPTTYGKSNHDAEKLLEKHCEIARNPHNRTVTTAEFIKLAENCDAVIAGTEPITGEALEKLPCLKVISRYGAGIDNVDIAAADRLGIKLFRTPLAPARAVAELTVCLILDAARHTPIMHAEMKNGIWQKRTGFLLEGKNVAIVGFGRIGQMVAGLLSSFGVSIRYHDIEKKEGAHNYEPSLDSLLSWAHVITLHCSSAVDGRPVIGRYELAKMRDNAILVNTARGTLIDEEALYERLVTCPNMTAALDVYRKEPYEGKLAQLPNVIMTPHIASAAREARALMDMEAAVNCLEGLGVALLQQ